MAKSAEIWDRIYSNRLAMAMFWASIVYVVVISTFGWNGMLSHLHAFRQTQTAISVSYLLKGGPWIAYETPIYGPPWSAPMEFPLYQWIVALVVKSGFFALNQAGRFVSEFFFLSALYPLFKFLEFFQISSRQRYLILIIFCVSPQYLFWSRSFMIESTALALSLYFIWLVFLCCEQISDNRANWLTVVGMTAAGVMAGLVKVTTFFPFLVGACILIVFYTQKKYRIDGNNKKSIIALWPVCIFAVIVPFVVVSAWTAYADYIKSLNPYAVPWTSESLKAWNFGTLEQRLSLKTWQNFYSVTLSNLIGNSHLAAISIISIVLCRKKCICIALVCLGLFLLTLMTFTNLHFVHTYYSYANGIFLIIALGFVVTDLIDAQNILKRAIGVALFCLIVFCSGQHFFAEYWKFQNQSFDFSPITKAIETHSRENDVFIAFGTQGSAEIPYYLNRRIVSLGNGDLQDPALIALKERLKEYRIGGLIIYSRTGFGHFKKQDYDLIDNFAGTFQITPGDNAVYPWYKSGSEIILAFNSAQ